MQKDLFKADEEIGWEVLEVRYKEPTWNNQNKTWDYFPIYIHTKPLNWNPPKHYCDVPPWEKCDCEEI